MHCSLSFVRAVLLLLLLSECPSIFGVHTSHKHYQLAHEASKDIWDTVVTGVSLSDELFRYACEPYHTFDREKQITPRMLRLFESEIDDTATQRINGPKIDLLTTEDQGMTTLMCAAAATTTSFRFRVKLVKLLLAAGCDVNLQSNMGLSALMYAANSGNDEVADLLLGKVGTDVNMRDREGKTALMYVMSRRQSEMSMEYTYILLALLKRGADPTISSHYTTPLKLAVQYDNLYAVRALLADTEHSVDVNADSPVDTKRVTEGHTMHETAVVLTFVNGSGISLEILQALIAHGADVNRRFEFGRNVLIMACINERRLQKEKLAEMIDLLLKTGGNAMVNVPDAFDKTSLVYALEYYNPAVVRVLLKHSPSVRAVARKPKLVSRLLECLEEQPVQMISDYIFDLRTGGAYLPVLPTTPKFIEAAKTPSQMEKLYLALTGPTYRPTARFDDGA